MNQFLEEKLNRLKGEYLNREVYIMVQHSNYHGDISFPLGTIVDVFVGSMDTIHFKWEKKHELPWNVSKHYQFSEYDKCKLFETEKEIKEYYRDYI